MTEEEFEKALIELLNKAAKGGLDADTICAIAEWTLEGQEWSTEEG